MLYNAVLDVQFDFEVSGDPVTLAEVSNFLKLSSENDISLAVTMARNAVIMCEKYANISIKYKQVKTVLCNLQGGILLPYGPVFKNSTFVFKDKLGNNLNYELSPKTGDVCFLNLIEPRLEWIYAEYDAGYSYNGTTNRSYPEWAKLAILQQTAYLWANRGDETFGMDNMAKLTLAPYKRVL